MSSHPEPRFPVLGARRGQGVLLHPTSLPSPLGCGDLGPAAWRFLDWLAEARAAAWQMLPVVPPGAAASPYDGRSAMAGHPLLVSPELLVEDGLLSPEELADAAPTRHGTLDEAAARRARLPLLRLAWRRLRERPRERDGLTERAAAAGWLDDWALFASLRERLDGRAWLEWPDELRRREPSALAAARHELAEEIDFHRTVQLLFLDQWRRLRRRAEELGVLLFGDVPIYVALDSADVWAHQELFDLEADGRPRHQAGVPPDYFSATGQLWGNPLYRWQRAADEGFAWWRDRLRQQLSLFHLLRLDHFRAFAGFWEVAADARTAEHGAWRQGPGEALFRALAEECGGELPLVAEDLGHITEDVEALRRRLGLPGMRVLQFAFGEDDSLHQPHRHEALGVVYTGTHDTATTRGWYSRLPPPEKERLRRYLGPAGRHPHRVLVRVAATSVARLAVYPLQDVLGLGDEARMNVPGVAAGNWAWSLRPGQLRPAHAGFLCRLAVLTGRAGHGGRAGA